MIENLNEFKKLYSEFYEALPEAYTEPIFPFFVQIGKDYRDTRPKCLFIGKATNGWITDSRNVDCLFDRNNSKRIVCMDDPIEWVERASGSKDGYNTRGSAFWRVIKATMNVLFPNGDWYTHIAWSNLYKFSPESGNPGLKLQKLQRDVCNRILDKEIECLEPDFVIFLTSGWEWFYAERRGLKNDPEKCIAWDGDRNKLYYQTQGETTFIMSKHPERKKEAPHIEALTRIIREKM